MNFGVDLFWPASAAVFLVLCAVGLHLVAYLRTSRPVPGGVRGLLVLIRLLAVALLVFALWRPAAESQETLQRKGRLVLLIDSSRSMSIGDETAGPSNAPVSRLARAAAVFSENSRLWLRVAGAYDVAAYSFARQIDPLPVAAGDLSAEPLFGVEAAGEVTALGEALMKGASGVPPPQAVLVVSDGLSNSGVDPLTAVSGVGAPVYCISVGGAEPSESTRDIAATGIFAPSQGFKNSEMTVLGEFNLTGLAGRDVKVTFSADGRALDSKEISAARGEEIAEARFTYQPERTGPVRLEVRAEPLTDEIVAVNNAAATYTDVKEGGIKILHIEGDFRWEAKFIRLALEGMRDAEVRFVIPRARAREELSSALGEDWDVLVLGSAPAALFPAQSLSRIVEAVSDEGKGLVFLGGPRAFALGGWGKTPVAALCPFEFSADEIFDPCLWVAEPQKTGVHSEILRISGEDDFSVWGDLSPLLALNTVGKPRPGASVLLIGKPKKRDKATGALSVCPLRDDRPLFALQEYGKGRTAAFAGEGTWQWVTGAGIEDEAARDGAAAAHKRFWRNVVNWAADRQPRGEITLDIETGTHRVKLGDGFQMRARVLDERGEPVGGFEVTAGIDFAGTKEKRALVVDGNGYRLDWDPPAAGQYRVNVKARRQGKELASGETAFITTAVDVEYVTLVSRPSVLAALALAAGGRYAAADDAPYVLDDIMANATSTRYTTLRRRELWSSPWYLAAVLGLLTVEWVLRKLVGLV
ncbi:MAG: hypothetical protein ACYTAN_02860 [Planctomycetota bacterium]|jgi:hypothetical protein